MSMKIVTTFEHPAMGATGYVYSDGFGKRFWQITGVGIGGQTEIVEVPFQIPHDDFASAIARGYFRAIYDAASGTERNRLRVAMDLCFNYKLPEKKAVPVLPEDVEIPEHDLRRIASHLSGGYSSDPGIVGMCNRTVYCQVAVGQYPSDSESWRTVRCALGEKHPLVKKFVEIEAR